MLEYNEKTYKSVGRVGGGNIAIGVILIVSGVTLGVLTIINGAKMLNARKTLID